MASLDNLSSAYEVASLSPTGDVARGKPVDIPILRTAYKNAVKDAAKKQSDKYAKLKEVTSKTLQCIQTIGGAIADGVSEVSEARTKSVYV